MSMITRKAPSLLDRATDRVAVAIGNLAFMALRRVGADLRLRRQSRLAAEVRTTGEMGFEVTGKAGEVKTIREWPEEWFLPEKLIVVESSTDPESLGTLDGSNTEVVGAFCGPRNVMPFVEGGVPSSFYASDRYGNRLVWGWCALGQSITFRVRFIKDCTWRAVVFGKFDRQGLLRSVEEVK